MIFNLGDKNKEGIGEKIGKCVSFDDASNKGLAYLKNNGYTLQDGTPTPDAPVEIQGLGDSGSIEVKTCKKNLFNPQVFLDCGFTETNGEYSGTTNLLTAIPLLEGCFKPNTQYTISVDAKVSSDNGNGRFAFKYTDGTSSSTTYTNATEYTNYKKVSDSGKTVEKIIYAYSSGRTLTFKNLQLEEGTQVTPFEPYEGTVANILIDAPLYEGDYIELYADGRGELVRVNEKVVFNGTESWTLGGSNTLLFTYVTNNPKDKLIEVYCSHYQSSTKYWTLTAYNQCGFIGDNIRQFCIKENDYTNATDFKAWLQSNPITVVYELETPTRTPLTEEQIIEFKKLMTFESVTNVLADGVIEVGYYKNNLNGEYMANHIHDDRYYTEPEVDKLLESKSSTDHNHDSVYAKTDHNHDGTYAKSDHNHSGVYASSSHNHDERYYTETEVKSLFNNFFVTETLTFSGYYNTKEKTSCKTGDITKSGYTPIAIVGVYPDINDYYNEGDCAISEFKLSLTDKLASVTLKNTTGTAFSDVTGKVDILYRKNM